MFLVLNEYIHYSTTLSQFCAAKFLSEILTVGISDKKCFKHRILVEYVGEAPKAECNDSLEHIRPNPFTLL